MSGLILGIETSTRWSSVALCDSGELVAMRVVGPGHAPDAFLAPAVAGMLSDSSRAWDDVAGIATGNGPGLFTGLRVGIATALAFGAFRGVPVRSVPSLDALGRAYRHAGRVRVCMDARRRQVIWADYDAGRRLEGFVLTAPDAAVTDALIVGDAVKVYPHLLNGVWDVPSAGAVAEMFADGDPRVRPLYSRKSDAELKALGS